MLSIGAALSKSLPRTTKRGRADRPGPFSLVRSLSAVLTTAALALSTLTASCTLNYEVSMPDLRPMRNGSVDVEDAGQSTPGIVSGMRIIGGARWDGTAVVTQKNCTLTVLNTGRVNVAIAASVRPASIDDVVILFTWQMADGSSGLAVTDLNYYVEDPTVITDPFEVGTRSAGVFGDWPFSIIIASLSDS